MDAAYQALPQEKRDAQDKVVLTKMQQLLWEADGLILYLSPEQKGPVQKAIEDARYAIAKAKS